MRINCSGQEVTIVITQRDGIPTCSVYALDMELMPQCIDRWQVGPFETLTDTILRAGRTLLRSKTVGE